jgi:type VI protein secretion system component Hcp
MDSQRGPVPGEIERNGFKNWFEILSWSPGRQRSGPNLQEWGFTKRMDSSSMRISECYLNRTTVQAYFEATTRNQQGEEYVSLKITMMDALISGHSAAGGGAEDSAESFSISASAVSIQYLGPPEPVHQPGPVGYQLGA